MIEHSLYEIFRSHAGRQIDKWEHYFPIYEKHFSKYRGQKVRVLELGVDHGGSLQMWKRYFGFDAEIIGIDINQLSMYEEPQIKTYWMDQTDPEIAKFGPFDIVIDDGSHVLEHQTASFHNLWGYTRGIYLIEDCHKAYPWLTPEPGLVTRYDWVIVSERPTRRIVGTPSRPLRDDEKAARDAHGA